MINRNHAVFSHFSVKLFNLIWVEFAPIFIYPKVCKSEVLHFSECHLAVLMHKRNRPIALQISTVIYCTALADVH